LYPILKTRPYLIDRIPRSRPILWPYYDQDVAVWVDPRNEVERVMITGAYDSDVSNPVKRFVGPGAHCIDVGANIGAVTLLFAKLVGPAGRVLAIEPGIPYRKRLLANLEANPALRKRVEILPVGISDAPGTLQWTPDPNRPFNAAILPGLINASGIEGHSVPVKTLDEVMDVSGWDRLDFIKVDVEGMELEVFRGAHKTLAKYRPVVLFESMPWARGYRRETSGLDVFTEITNMLTGIGYRAFELTGAGDLHERIDPDTWPENTLAIPDTKVS
jgi:FkbM family methyltransferase